MTAPDHPSNDAPLDLAPATRICNAAFTEHAARLSLPSLAWGLVDCGAVVAGESTGAVYRIASMTKSFTAAVVLALRDDGLLRLDDPVMMHAPELSALRHPLPGAPAITIRHLLTMSSGLSTDDAWADRHLDLSDAELDALIAAGLSFAAVPGTVFEYSNLGYATIGRVVRNVAGATVQDLVVDRLTGPLAMSRTTWTAPPGDSVPGYRARTSTEDPLVVEPAVADGVMAAMGGLFSCVEDLATWVGFLSAGFDLESSAVHEAVLSAASRREMQQVARSYAAERAVATGEWTTRAGGYGFGLNVLPHPKLGTIATHSGGLPGFGSNMRWVPATGIGLIALANATYAPMSQTTTTVLDLLAADGAVTVPSAPASPGLIAAAERLAALLGAWDDALATDLFTDNVDPDEPLADRRDAAVTLRDDHGPFVLARVVAESATSAVAVLHGPRVEVHVDFRLWPSTPARVQQYDVSVVS